MFEQESNIPGNEDDLLDHWADELEEEPGEDLSDLTPNIHYHRPLIMMGVMTFAIYLLTGYSEEISYLVGTEQATDIGAVTDFATRSAKDPNWKPEIPHNRYVSVSGIPSRTSLSCKSSPPTRYFKLVGGHVYIEQPLEDLDLLECETKTQKRTQYRIEDTSYFEGKGRAISMEQAGDRYQAFRAFYEKSYGELFCASMTDAKREQHLGLMRQVLRRTHKDKTGKDITEAELETALAKETICHDAWLIQIGKAPRSFAFWLWPPIALLLIILWDIIALFLWTRRTLQVLRS